MNDNQLRSLDSFINEQYGTRGNKMREEFEHGFETFKQEFLKPQPKTRYASAQPKTSAMA